MHPAFQIIVMTLLILSPIAIMLPLIFWLGNSQNRKAWNFTGMIADELGIILNGRNEKHRMYDFPVLDGYYKKRKIEIYTKEAGSGKGRTRITILRVHCNCSYSNTFKIENKSWFYKIAIALGAKHIETSNDAFNKKFILRSNNSDFVKNIFDFNFSALILQAKFPFNFIIKFEGSHFEYTENSIILTDACRQRFIEIAKLCNNLCVQLEKKVN